MQRRAQRHSVVGDGRQRPHQHFGPDSCRTARREPQRQQRSGRHQHVDAQPVVVAGFDNDIIERLRLGEHDLAARVRMGGDNARRPQMCQGPNER